MSKEDTDKRRDAILAKARARRAELAMAPPTDLDRQRSEVERRVKIKIRKYINEQGIETKKIGRVLGFRSAAKLPRHLGPGQVTLEDLIALTEYFEDFDINAIIRDILVGADEHPDEAQARREGKIEPEHRLTPRREAVEGVEEEERPKREEELVIPDELWAPEETDEAGDQDDFGSEEAARVWAQRFNLMV